MPKGYSRSLLRESLIHKWSNHVHQFCIAFIVWVRVFGDNKFGDLELKKALILSVVVMLMVVLVPGANLASAAPGVQQTNPGCPTYQTNLAVDFVNSIPHLALVGDTVVTTFHVVYPDGTPVTLSPETASFNWTGPSGSKEFDNVPVVFNGTAGFYNYTQPFTQDIVQATGAGTITIAAVVCSCQDALGNRGPTGLISSIQTLITSDDSQIAPPTPTPTPAQMLTNYLVPIAILILLVLAFLLLLLRRRGKKK